MRPHEAVNTAQPHPDTKGAVQYAHYGDDQGKHARFGAPGGIDSEEQRPGPIEAPESCPVHELDNTITHELEGNQRPLNMT